MKNFQTVTAPVTQQTSTPSIKIEVRIYLTEKAELEDLSTKVTFHNATSIEEVLAIVKNIAVGHICSIDVHNTKVITI